MEGREGQRPVIAHTYIVYRYRYRKGMENRTRWRGGVCTPTITMRPRGSRATVLLYSYRLLVALG
jgi:hypothetical protein